MNEAHHFVKGMAALFMALLCLVQTGCFEYPTDFTYGKAGDQSVNGVSVFANLLRERGHSVSVKSRLTRRIEKFDTIVWAPNNSGHPPENVSAWLEQWLNNGNPRVLIYIGRSYDAKLDFIRGKFENAEPEQREQWRRELADEILQSRRNGFDWSIFASGSETNYWFGTEEESAEVVTKLGGPWSEGVDVEKANIDCDSLLKPLKDYNDEEFIPQQTTAPDDDSPKYVFEQNWDKGFREKTMQMRELLTVDGMPFAFEVFPQANPNQKLIIISNGSFFLNYPLVKPENRKLAAKVADEVTGDVVFLESDFRWPRVGGAANDPALRWTWIGRAPMNYIVPHFLLWGVLYCFAFYPNFGRPKRIQFHPPKAFRSHVKAVASILGRSKEKSWAREVVDMWLKRTNKTKH